MEKLENLAEKTIMFLRPRKLGKNLTPLRNSYHILRFNFSGIDTENEETTMRGFRKEVESSIKLFDEKYVKLYFIV